MLNRKNIFFSVSIFASLILVCSLSFVDQSAIQVNLAEGTAYTIGFGASKNKIGTDSYASGTFYNGTGTAETALGGSVSFAYNGFANPSDVWQTIQGGGYFTNTDPIHGMQSITLTKSDSSASLQIFWSASTTFSDTKSATYDSSSVLSFTCDFSGYYPNYIKVVALGSGNSSITSASITFSCSEHYALGSSFSLGKYPQTVVEDSTLLTALEGATDTDGDGYLEYGSDEYVKVTATPKESDYQSTSRVTTFVSGTAYYFKVEPIKWKVLSGTGTATGLVVAEKVLTHGVYFSSWASRNVSGSAVNPNNYQYSTLRAMLNGYNGASYSVDDFSGKGFLDVAFTDVEKTHITTSTVDNSDASMGGSDPNNYSCDNTNDKIFALSRQELTNTNYGFNSDAKNTNPARRVILTDYARATGAEMSIDSSYYGGCRWWSRSPCASYENGHVDDISIYGAFGYNYISCATNGVRPAFNVDIG